ncbi:hypothetical protein K439DRAFT_1631079 [Ramaria rubella]|nr:hypothetical protein K439DRAFT_1631079 [Ramaria rubella]
MRLTRGLADIYFKSQSEGSDDKFELCGSSSKDIPSECQNQGLRCFGRCINVCACKRTRRNLQSLVTAQPIKDSI